MVLFVHLHQLYQVVLVVLEVLEILYHLSLPEDLGVRADLKFGELTVTHFYTLQLKDFSVCVWTSELEKGEVKLFPVYITTAGTDEETRHLLSVGLLKKNQNLRLS